MKYAITVVFVIVSSLSLQQTYAETPLNWPSWRGPNNMGSVDAGTYPAKWTVENIHWKAELGGKGCSTPIVWKDRIYVTTPTEEQDSLVALDSGGERFWTTKFGKENPGKHRNGSGCNASPVTDGEGIFIYFKSGTFAAVNMDGTIRWQKNLVDQYGKANLFWDHGTSPVLTKKHVVMARMHNGESWLAAFDKTSGELKWKVARNYTTPTEGDHGYTTPLVMNRDGKEGILVWGAEHLTWHDAANGKAIWDCGNFNPEAKGLWPSIATPVVVGDIAVIAYGRNDRGIPRLHGVRLGGKGDVTETNHLWKRTDIGTFVPTPVAYKDKVYLVGDKGDVHCINPTTGKTIWSDAFPKNRARFYSSPSILGGRLYAAREDGTVFVADVTDGFKLLSENAMNESIIASPVAHNSHLLLRGIHHLYCVSGE